MRHLIAGALIALAVAGCSGDVPVAPAAVHAADLAPPDLIAAYHRVDLSLGGGSSGTVTDVNDSGVVLGVVDGGQVLWMSSTSAPVPIGGSFVGHALADDGTIAGNADGRPATWRSGDLTILDEAAGDATTICHCEPATAAGWALVDGARHAAIWVGGVRIDAGIPDGATESEFTDIAPGYVVGEAGVVMLDKFGTLRPLPQPFRWGPATGWGALCCFFVLTNGPVVSAEGLAMASGYVGLNVIPTSREWDITGASPTSVGPPGQGPWHDNFVVAAINDSSIYAFTQPGFDAGDVSYPASVGVGGPISGILPGSERGAASSINDAGVVGGNVGPQPVLWVPDAPLPRRTMPRR